MQHVVKGHIGDCTVDRDACVRFDRTSLFQPLLVTLAFLFFFLLPVLQAPAELALLLP